MFVQVFIWQQQLFIRFQKILEKQLYSQVYKEFVKFNNGSKLGVVDAMDKISGESIILFFKSTLSKDKTPATIAQ